MRSKDQLCTNSAFFKFCLHCLQVLHMHDSFCVPLGVFPCSQKPHKSTFIALCLPECSKRVYQGVRVKHTVKDLLAEKRSRQTNGPRYTVSPTPNLTWSMHTQPKHALPCASQCFLLPYSSCHSALLS